MDNLPEVTQRDTRRFPLLGSPPGGYGIGVLDRVSVSGLSKIGRERPLCRSL